MKASIKFREDQKPLVKAKVPLSILGLPFQSGIVAGESKELSLNLSTFFESGPSIRIAYRPNDTWHPFSLVVKTGTGPFGSPVSSSMLMSAEFNLLGSGNPAFMLHFKPQFGDFSIKKSQSSLVFEKSAKSNASVSSDDDGSIEVVESPVVNGEVKRITTVLPPHTAGAVASAFSGMEVAARTKLPVRSRAVVSFRWGVRIPAEIRSGRGGDSIAGINWRKVPFLAMNKVGIEHVDGGDELKSKKGGKKEGTESGNADVGEVCFAVKRQLEILQAENGMLRKAVDDLREEIAGARANPEFSSGKYRELDRNGLRTVNGKNGERRSNEKRSVEGSVNEELKKALKGAASGGGIGP